MRIGFAQINPTVGDLARQLRKDPRRLRATRGRGRGAGPHAGARHHRLSAAGSRLQIALRPAKSRGARAPARAASGRCRLLVGFVDRNEGRGQAVSQRRRPARTRPADSQDASSRSCPTYDVFDEDRYFEPGAGGEVFSIAGRRVGVTICEDIWTSITCRGHSTTASRSRSLVEQGAEMIVNLSASPFGLGKPAARREMVAALARSASACPIFYCNVVGGNDQLVFDGNSIAFNRSGRFDRAAARLSRPRKRSSRPIDHRIPLELSRRPDGRALRRAVVRRARLSGEMRFQIRRARPQRRHRFRGRRRHRRRTRWARRTSSASPCPARIPRRGSVDDALALARNLGIRCLQIPIGDAFAAFKAQFSESLRRPARGHDRGKHAVASARHDPDGALE